MFWCSEILMKVFSACHNVTIQLIFTRGPSSSYTPNPIMINTKATFLHENPEYTRIPSAVFDHLCLFITLHLVLQSAARAKNSISLTFLAFRDHHRLLKRKQSVSMLPPSYDTGDTWEAGSCTKLCVCVCVCVCACVSRLQSHCNPCCVEGNLMRRQRFSLTIMHRSKHTRPQYTKLLSTTIQ